MKIDLKKVYGKYNLFLDKINYFWKRKTTEILEHAYMYTCMHTHAQALCTHA